MTEVDNQHKIESVGDSRCIDIFQTTLKSSAVYIPVWIPGTCTEFPALKNVSFVSIPENFQSNLQSIQDYEEKLLAFF